MLVLSYGDYHSATETLTTLQTQYPNNPVVLNLLKQTYLHNKEWQPLLNLLPKLVKTKKLTQDEADKLTLKAQSGALENIANQKGTEDLLAHWNGLSRKLKSEPTLMRSASFSITIAG